MDKNELKVGQFFFYVWDEGHMPCRVVKINDQKFTVEFFHEEVDIHGPFFKGNRLRTELPFSFLKIKETGRYVKSCTKSEVLSFYANIVINTQSKLKSAIQKIKHLESDLKEKEKLFEKVSGSIC